MSVRSSAKPLTLYSLDNLGGVISRVGRLLKGPFAGAHEILRSHGPQQPIHHSYKHTILIQ